MVSSEQREFSGVLKRLPSRALDWPLDFAREAERGSDQWILVANGAGPRLAAEAAATALAAAPVEAVASIGWCGALDPALRPASVFVAAAVRSPGAEWRTRCAGAHGVLYSSDRFVGDAAGKRELHRAGAAAVDMEAAAVAEQAERRGLPFYCIRAVTDTARESFWLDFNTLRDAEGRIHRGLVLRAALGSPRRAVPELVRLASRCRQASEALGEFLVQYRF